MNFQLGLVLGLAAALMAFEYRSPLGLVEDPFRDTGEEWDYENEEIPITMREANIPKLPEPSSGPVTDPNMGLEIVPDDRPKPVEGEEMKSLPDINPDMTGMWEDDPDDLIGDIEVGEEVFDIPIDGYLPVFCDCADLPTEDQKELCNGQVLNAHIKKNMRYPRREKELKESGLVIAQYVVGRNGKVRDIEIVKSPSEGFSQEAERVLSLLPCIKPAEQYNHKVAVSYKIPIRFILQ